jgi:hypothetical protein
VTEPSPPEKPPASERTFLGASRPPKPPSEMTEAELDAFVNEVMRDIGCYGRGEVIGAVSGGVLPLRISIGYLVGRKAALRRLLSGWG